MTNNSTKKAVSTMNERLWTFAQQLPSENKFQAVLKLQLMRKSLKHERIQKSEHEKMCRKCHISWSAGYFSVEIIPGCKRNRRQIDQLQSKGELTKQQQSLLEYLKTRVGRTAKYTCGICSYKTRVQLDSNVKLPECKAAITVSKDEQREKAYQQWLEETQRKRKRHGKSTAGLKIPSKLTQKAPNTPSATSTLNATGSKQANPVSQPAAKKGSTPFKPTDFRLIQKLLQSSMASKAKNMQPPKAKQANSSVRFGRN
uniref:Uncharacterized protein n=1 Tax=Anopheles coluzzii TaxID=1518534 RepID=A0A6E8VTG6_ANOCL|nr:uncharacterized protein LOC120955309 [Anopheles coluzzii]